MKIILLSLCFCVKIKLWSNHIFISSWLLSRLVYVVFFVRLWSGFSDFCKIEDEDNTVVSISSRDWRLTRSGLSGIEESTISQQKQWRCIGQRTEKEQLWFPKKEYITENLVNGCWGRIILFQTDAIVGILSTQSAIWNESGKSRKSGIATADLHHGKSK